MEYLSGLLAELLLIFQDFKFWIKKRRRRQYERKHNLPKTKVLYPSQKIFIAALLILLGFFVARGAFFLSGNAEAHTTIKLSEVASLLRNEKKTSDRYPAQLETVVRNNPLL